MTWVGRFGNRPHSLVAQDDLFDVAKVAENLGLPCTLCNEPAVGLVHCNDCGWTRRFCDQHRPKTDAVEHVKRLHAAICEPAKGSN